jgi:5-methylcytosine-specific restriction endonuclease McrA
MLKHMYKNDNCYCFDIKINGTVHTSSHDDLNFAKIRYTEMDSNHIFQIQPISKKRKIAVKSQKKKVKKVKKEKYNRKKFPACDKYTIRKNSNFECKMCHQIPDMELELDHMIPLQYKGPDAIYNLQPLCSKCHAIKTQKVDCHIKNILIPLFIKKEKYDKITGQMCIKMEAMCQIRSRIEKLQTEKLNESIIPDIFKKINDKSCKIINIVNNFYDNSKQFKIPTDFAKMMSSVETINITNNFNSIRCECPTECDCDIYF